MDFDISNVSSMIVDSEDLFGQSSSPGPDETQDPVSEEKTGGREEEKKETEEIKTPVESGPVESSELFGDPEEVDGEQDKQEKENTNSGDPAGSSPTVYSSIASGLQEEGIFLDLENEKPENIKSVEDFARYFEKQIEARLSDEQKRIQNALNAGVEPEEIQRYESSLKFLNGITEEQISKEGDDGDTLRKRIIYQDYINNGASREKAIRMTEMSFTNGTDVEDAKEALKSNIKYYQGNYDSIIKEQEEERKSTELAYKESVEALKKTMLSTEEPIKGLKVGNKVRQKAYDAVTKPVYQDKETGNYYTEVQKYQMDHPEEFRHKIGILYAITNGFQSLDGVIDKKVSAETKKGLKEIETKLSGVQVTQDGTLDLSPFSGAESSFRLAKEVDQVFY